jgi:TorA maturation chaperone TorD
MNDASLYSLLAPLWLRELADVTLAHTRAIPALASTLETADLTTLAAAYADLFLLNVYPYGTAFTDEEGELNTAEALRVAALFAAHGYAPHELSEVGAPDHVGLCLGFLAHLDGARHGSGQVSVTPHGARRSNALAMTTRVNPETIRGDFLVQLAHWLPVCCLAVQRDPTAHPFYRALAQLTRETLMADSEWLIVDSQSQINLNHQPPTMRHSLFAISHQPDDEVSLRDLVRFFLAPAQCGMFLSRARLGHLARALEMRLPFGSRFEVAEWLFVGAGQQEALLSLLTVLRVEAEAWANEYRAWAQAYPQWQPMALRWLERIAQTQHTLDEMERVIRMERET